MRLYPRLRSLLTFNFALVAVIPVFVAGFSAVVLLTADMEREINRRNLLLARSLAGEVERFLDEPRSLLGHAADVIARKKLLERDTIRAYLESINTFYRFFDKIQVLDNNGIVRHLAPFKEAHVGLDLSRQPFYTISRSMRKPCWSSPFISMDTGQSTLVLTRPFEKGMIVGYLNLGTLNDIISKVEIGEKGYATVVDNKGTILAHRKHSFVSQRLNIKNMSIIQQGLAGKEGTFRYRFEDAERLGSVAVVPQTRWLVIITQPLEEALAPVDRIRAVIWTGVALGGILALVIAFVSLKKTLGPFSRLVSGARKIAHGDYHIETLPRSYPEIDELEADFRIMAEAVKSREQALRESEEKYRVLFENAGEAVFVVQDGFIKFANPTTEALSGYREGELAVTRLDEFVHPEDREIVMDRHARRLTGGQVPSTYSFRVVSKTGDTVWIQLNAVLINWEGRPATLNFMRDITYQRKLETQFQEAQKLESIGTLAGGIAHNFNNVLMGIQGRTSLVLMDKDADHPDRVHLEGIESYVRNAAELTKDLLAFARGGRYEVTPTDLNALVQHENRMFGETRKEINVHGIYKENLWTVEVDQGQIRQALLNLYVNAWQAMPGGGDLYVQTENITIDENTPGPFDGAAGRYVKISVTDTGTGMDAAVKEKIFDPFFSTNEMGMSTGLGLASVYGIIRNHGGFINVYSEKGEGTTFNLYLPASEKAVAEEKSAAGKVVRGEGTILLVDDEEMILDVGRELLSHLGYEVITAAGGKEAIAVYEKNRARIDVVILDMIMPGMGGREVFERLKETDPGTRVLLSSGYSLNGQAQEILDSGCDGFIQKPFNLKEISRKVREIFDHKER